MSRRSDGLTGELFASIPKPVPRVPETMDFRRPVAQLVAKLLKETPLDRYEVAAHMSRLAGHETSAAILDSYTAVSREECNIPLWKAPLIEIATERRDLAEWHANVLGGRVLWGEEVIDADIGGLDRQIAELQEKRRSLKQYQQLSQLKRRSR